MIAMPASVARIRRECCLREGCSHRLDYADPCISCPEGHFSPWVRCGEFAEPLHPARTTAAVLPAHVSQGGPGTELKALLARIGIHAAPTCACNRRAAEMDRRGADWCEANVEKIVTWLGEEAARRSLPFFAAPARFIIRQAIKRSRRRASDPPQDPLAGEGSGF